MWYIHTLSLPYSYTGEKMEFLAILFIFCFIIGVVTIFFILKYYKQDLDEIVDEFSKRKPK